MATDNRQLGINMIASVVAFVAQYAISFLLTPYIVKELGVAAYGFVGLSNQIIGYSSLVTVALNSMAGRFVTIEYHKGNIEKANKYFSSVLYCNLIVSAFLLLISTGLVLYLDLILDIPNELIPDVKLLFATLSVNTVVALLANVYGVATFVKNRLDYENIRNVIGNFLRTLVLVILFSLFAPKVWYFGVTTIIATLYLYITNFRFTRKLTPDLKISKRMFDVGCINELIASGVWNTVTKLSSMLETGFNLLIANIFVGAKMAGIYSISAVIPTMINSICVLMSSNFAPSWTELYATGDREGMVREMFKSIRIMGFLSSIPIAVFAVQGSLFYKLWLPSEDFMLLYWLSVVGSFVMLVAMPLEPLWNIFTITNKVKQSSLNLLEWSVAMFVFVMAGMFLTDDIITRLFIIASVKSVLASVRTLTFLPVYGSKCVDIDKRALYIAISRNLLCTSLIIAISYVASQTLFKDTWLGLILGTCLTIIIGFACNWWWSLNNNDRKYFIKLIQSRL